MRSIGICLLVLFSSACATTKPFAAISVPHVWEVSGDVYRITLCRGGRFDQQVVISGLLPAHSGQEVRHPEGVRVRVFWQDISEAEREWRIEVVPDPQSELGVYEVEFPLLLVHQLATDGRDRLIVPYGSGQVIRDPFHAPSKERGGRPRQRTAIWYGIYGQLQQNMQMLIYDSHDDKIEAELPSRGMMLWTRDPDLNIKDFEVSRNLDGADLDRITSPVLRAGVHHFPANTGRPGVGYASGYPVVTTIYDGGWESAVERYRQWAVKQRWCAGGTILDRIARGDLPQWYRNNAMWMTAINGNNAQWLRDVIRPAFAGVEIGVFLTQWQHWPFDVNLPAYFPPKDEPSYRGIIALQDQGFHIFPYMNVNLVDVEQPDSRFDALVTQANMKGPMVNPGQWNVTDDPFEYWGTQQEKLREFVDALRAVRDRPWTDPEVQALVSPTGSRLYSDWFWAYGYEKDAIRDYLQMHWPDRGVDAKPEIKMLENRILRVKRKFNVICRDTDRWYNTFADLLSQNLKSVGNGGYGTDGHYLDQFDASGTAFICFVSNHLAKGESHQPGFGNYTAMAGRRLIRDLNRKFPGKVWMGEHCSEISTDVLQEHYVIFPSYYQNELLPLWAMVYQGYTCLHEWPLPRTMLSNLDDLSSSIAWSVHLGFKLGSFVTIETWMDLFKPENQKALAYLQNLVALQLKMMDRVAYGQRLADPTLTTEANQPVPTQHVNWQDMSGKVYPRDVPVVRGSCWKSRDPSPGHLILLSNSSDQPVNVRIQTPVLQAGMVLTDLQTSATNAYRSDQVFTVPAYGWLALATSRNGAATHLK